MKAPPIEIDAELESLFEDTSPAARARKRAELEQEKARALAEAPLNIAKEMIEALSPEKARRGYMSWSNGFSREEADAISACICGLGFNASVTADGKAFGEVWYRVEALPPCKS